MKSIVLMISMLLVSTVAAKAAFQEYVMVYDAKTRISRMVKNCVAPNLVSLTPQPGFTAAQTCVCNWADGGGASYVLTCAMPTGSQQLQTAAKSRYMLVLSDYGKLVPVDRISFCRTTLDRERDYR